MSQSDQGDVFKLECKSARVQVVTVEKELATRKLCQRSVTRAPPAIHRKRKKNKPSKRLDTRQEREESLERASVCTPVLDRFKFQDNSRLRQQTILLAVSSARHAAAPRAPMARYADFHNLDPGSSRCVSQSTQSSGRSAPWE